MWKRIGAFLVRNRWPIASILLALFLALLLPGDGRLLVMVALVPLCLLLWMLAIRPRRTKAVRWSIFSLQFAGHNKNDVTTILQDWHGHGLLRDAQCGVWWDFVFLFAYALLGGVLAHLTTALPIWSRLAWLPAAVSIGGPICMAVAAALDFIEDRITYRVLGEAIDSDGTKKAFESIADSDGPRHLTWFALAKFAFLGLGIVPTYLSFCLSALTVAFG